MKYLYHFRFDNLQNEVNGKFEKISQSLVSLRENYHSELENLRSDLTQRIDDIPTKCKSDDGFKEAEERMHSILLERYVPANENIVTFIITKESGYLPRMYANTNL